MEAIRELQSEGYRFTLEGDQIHYTITEGRTPDKEKVVRLFAELKEHKTEAVALLKASACPSKGQDEILDPGPDMKTIPVFSHVLNREVFISWQGENPQTILFDGVAYTIDEIAKLKEMPLTPDELRAIHQVEVAFEGSIESSQ